MEGRVRMMTATTSSVCCSMDKRLPSDGNRLLQNGQDALLGIIRSIREHGLAVLP